MGYPEAARRATDRSATRARRLPDVLPPMAAAVRSEPFDSPSHLFEVKWDGARALAFVESRRLRVQDRHLRNVTALFPELQQLARGGAPAGAVLDGEIVALDDEGRPDMARLLPRLTARDGEEAEELAQASRVSFQAFDILYHRGRPVMDQPLWKRKRLLEDVVRPNALLGAPGYVEREGVAFFEATRRHGLEGMVAKQADSPYLAGLRSEAWLKVKVYQREEFVVGGFTYGGRWLEKHRRRPREPVASLLLGLLDDDGLLRYAGEVTGGFTHPGAQESLRALDPLVSDGCPFREELRFQRLVFWCRPQLAATVRFAEWTPGGALRFPVFEMLRPDVPPESCTLEAAAAPAP